MKKMFRFFYVFTPGKKFIAQEILVLLITTILVVVIYGITFPVNRYFKNGAIAQTALKEFDYRSLGNISMVIDRKQIGQEWLIGKIEEKYERTSWEEIRKMAIKMSPPLNLYVWNERQFNERFLEYLKSMQWTPDAFAKYVNSKTVAANEIKTKKDIERRIKWREDEIYRSREISLYIKDNLIEILVMAFFIIALPLFIIRYFIYIFRWCIITLKAA